MAKNKTPPAPTPKAQDIQAAEPPKAKFKTIHAYRVERLTQFEYQAFRATLHEDGTYTEEPFDKVTLLNLIMRRVAQALNREAVEVFQANKEIMRPKEV